MRSKITYKYNKKPTKNTTKKYKKNKKQGGKAIDAGSYGCVFRPSLKCSDNANEYNPNNVSKLMYEEDIEKEIDEMNKVKRIIDNLPSDNKKYFLVSDTHTCSPSQLEDDDLSTFDKECSLFTKEGIDSTNVNNNLDSLRILNMPDGGITIDDFIRNMLMSDNKDKYTLFLKLNNSLIRLLKKGLEPINKNKLNHFDVKGNNILITKDGELARLIDWGLAGENDGNTIPKEIIDRSIHFNMPFSDIFFNSYVKKLLPEEFKRQKASPDFFNKKSGHNELMKIIAIKMLNITLNRSKGHFESVLGILHDIYKIYAVEMENESSKINYKILEMNTIIEYIQAVLLKYVDDNGIFNDTKYFYEVFTKNADIWGFLMCYTGIVGNGVSYGSDNSINYIINKKIINAICRILIRYCYSSEFATKPIDIDELVKELESLNTIARGEEEKYKSKTKKNKTKTKNLDIRYPTPVRKIQSNQNNVSEKFGFSDTTDNQYNIEPIRDE